MVRVGTAIVGALALLIVAGLLLTSFTQSSEVSWREQCKAIGGYPHHDICISKDGRVIDVK